MQKQLVTLNQDNHAPGFQYEPKDIVLDINNVHLDLTLFAFVNLLQPFENLIAWK